MKSYILSKVQSLASILLTAIFMMAIVWVLWLYPSWWRVLWVPFLTIALIGFILMILALLNDYDFIIFEVPLIGEVTQTRKYATIMAMGFLMMGFSMITIVALYPENTTQLARTSAMLFWVPATLVIIVAHIKEQRDKTDKPAKPNKSLGKRL